MKKIAIILIFFCSTTIYSQTVYVNNSTPCDFYIHTGDFVEIDCSSGTRQPTASSYPIYPFSNFAFGLTDTAYSVTIFSFATGATRTVQTQVGCGAGGSPTGTFPIGPISPCNIIFNVTWTDLPGGDVQIDIF